MQIELQVTSLSLDEMMQKENAIRQDRTSSDEGEAGA